MKIAHIADTHIKNLKYHEDYRACFDQMYEILREQEVDYIVHCGDIAHTKTQISPEFVEMASDFFGNLAKIATDFCYSWKPRRQPKEQQSPRCYYAYCASS